MQRSLVPDSEQVPRRARPGTSHLGGARPSVFCADAVSSWDRLGTGETLLTSGHALDRSSDPQALSVRQT